MTGWHYQTFAGDWIPCTADCAAHLIASAIVNVRLF